MLGRKPGPYGGSIGEEIATGASALAMTAMGEGLGLQIEIRYGKIF